MAALNGTQHAVTVLSPTAFAIGDTRDLDVYTGGGIVAQLPRKRCAPRRRTPTLTVPSVLQFQSLDEQLHAPHVLDIDFGKMGAPHNILLGFLAADAFQKQA